MSHQDLLSQIMFQDRQIMVIKIIINQEFSLLDRIRDSSRKDRISSKDLDHRRHKHRVLTNNLGSNHRHPVRINSLASDHRYHRHHLVKTSSQASGHHLLVNRRNLDL